MLSAPATMPACRLCSANHWWSVFGKRRRGKAGWPGSPAHDDQVRRDFTAPAQNRLWLTDITEHPTAEGKLYLCAVKDAYSGRIVGYSISDRMKARLAVNALASAVARRGNVAGSSSTPTAAARVDSTGGRNTSIVEVWMGRPAGCMH